MKASNNYGDDILINLGRHRKSFLISNLVMARADSL